MLNFLSLKQLLLIKGRGDELSVVNLTIIVDISGFHHLAHVWLVQIEEAGDLAHVLFKFIKRQATVLVSVPLHESFAQVTQILSTRDQVCEDGADTRLESCRFGEGSKICPCVQC